MQVLVALLRIIVDMHKISYVILAVLVDIRRQWVLMVYLLDVIFIVNVNWAGMLGLGDGSLGSWWRFKRIGFLLTFIDYLKLVSQLHSHVVVLNLLFVLFKFFLAFLFIFYLLDVLKVFVPLGAALGQHLVHLDLHLTRDVRLRGSTVRAHHALLLHVDDVLDGMNLVQLRNIVMQLYGVEVAAVAHHVELGVDCLNLPMHIIRDR